MSDDYVCDDMCDDNTLKFEEFCSNERPTWIFHGACEIISLDVLICI